MSSKSHRIIYLYGMYLILQSLLNLEIFRELDQTCLVSSKDISCKAGFFVWLDLFVRLRFDTHTATSILLA